MKAFPFLTLLTALSCNACGVVSAGTTVYNDPKPAGTVVAQGSFTGLNGQTVTGLAVIYRLTENNAYVIRIEGISTPSETGLQIQAEASGQTLVKTALRGTSGTQNYNTGLTETLTWESVSIHQPANPLTGQYGKAALLPVTD